MGAAADGCCGSASGFLANILSAASAISQLRLQTIFENVKPLQQALGSRQSRPFIVGGLATGVLIYCGHRWLKQKELQPSAWNLEREPAPDELLGHLGAAAGAKSNANSTGTGTDTGTGTGAGVELPPNPADSPTAAVTLQETPPPSPVTVEQSQGLLEFEDIE